MSSFSQQPFRSSRTHPTRAHLFYVTLVFRHLYRTYSRHPCQCSSNDVTPNNAAATLQHSLDHLKSQAIAFHKSTFAIFAYPPFPPSGKRRPAILGVEGVSKLSFILPLRLITGHAYLGIYSANFHPDNPTYCPECGANPYCRPRH